jgi:hypothetical protein
LYLYLVGSVECGWEGRLHMHTRSDWSWVHEEQTSSQLRLCTSSNRVLGLVIETVLIEDGSFLADVPSEMWCPSPHDGFWFISAKALS